MEAGMSPTPPIPSPGARRSFWLEEALAHDPGEPCPPLSSRLTADVCIVGGGFAGLWTANELVERAPGLRVVLLERDICGGGASGRNGGFLSSSWWDLPGLCRLFGEEEGLAYAQALADEIDLAGAWCRAHDVDAWFHREGILGARTGTWQEDIGAGDAVAFCERHGLGDRMVRLSAQECRAYADSPRFVGGSFIRDSATVQPARLARGLRRVALERGVRIFEGTRVRGVAGRPTVVRTDAGAVRADHVVITTGAWAAGWPEYRQSFGNIADYMVVTEPIPERLREIGWTSHVGIGDARELLYYLRRTDDDRIAIGGGTTGVLFGGRIGRRATHDRRIAEVAAQGLLWMFPQLEGVRFTHAWGGPIDHTASFVPFFWTRPPGNVHAGLGFSGHGLAQTKLGGKILASMALGARDPWTAMPVVGPVVGKVPPEPLRWPLLRIAVWALESGDRREDAGRPRGTVRGLIGGAPVRHRERLRAR
jgi:glycine/D-amino acid oxidase-like deaminating enzyme